MEKESVNDKSKVLSIYLPAPTPELGRLQGFGFRITLGRVEQELQIPNGPFKCESAGFTAIAILLVHPEVVTWTEVI